MPLTVPPVRDDQRRKLVTVLLAAPLIGAMLTVLPGGAVASPQPAVGAPAPAAAHTITLVTGDVVTVTTLADGAQTAEIDRPDDATGGVRLQQSNDDLYVLPDETLPLLAADKLDPQLFNVTDLIEMGYDDNGSGTVPLIATYTPAMSRAAAAPAPRGSKLVRKLPSVGGAALQTDKDETRTFWTTVAPAGSTSLQAGVAKLWLDGRVQADLKESVPQIGAPTAWAAGYDGAGVTVAVLDTGIDATHPDLVDQIDDKVSFVPGEDTSDVHGHGTHVGSTIVGTGAASNGDFRGVAPGADLIVGKVLANDGFGQHSWIIAGMQWAAQSGADIVNMSLGDELPSDGTDPLSMAVDALTAQHGTLFVIASGNRGPETISTPGAAASALTVGAVDKQDRLASFTSTGPIFKTGAIKPDISAPGVAINAARSQQMTTGSGLYRSISGTSMATPHVAGAAAILAQRHPDWTPLQLKNALMSSSKGLAASLTPYQVGNGRVDVAAAISSTVHATPSALLGNFTWPHEPTDLPVHQAITFANSGAADVTLNLALTATGPFSLSASSVTVPAGGSAEVSAIGDPTAAAPGSRNSAYVVGTDVATGQAVTRTSLALIKEDERYDLTIKLIDRAGNPATSPRVVVNRDGSFFANFYAVQGERTLRLPPGTYTVETLLDVPGESADSLGVAWLVAPETVLNGPAEVVLDARKARLLDTAAPQLAEDRQRKLDFRVDYASGRFFRDTYQVPIKYDDLYLTPTAAVTQGAFKMATRWRFGEPLLDLRAFGVLPIDTLVQVGSTLTAGWDALEVVHAGTGAASEYADLDPAGKAVIVTRSATVTPSERAQAAVAAGAKLLLVVNDGVGRLSENVGASPIPVASVHRDAGAHLIKLAESGWLRLTAKQTPYANYLYDLTRNYTGQVPDEPLLYHPTQEDLARIDARFSSVTDVDGRGYRYDMTFTPSAGFQERERYAGTRTEWVTPGQAWHETHSQGNGSLSWEDRAFRNEYAKGSTTELNWFAPAVHASFGEGYSVRNARGGDRMTLNVQAWTASGSVIDHGGTVSFGSVPESLSLYQGDALIQHRAISSDMQGVLVPAGTLPYRLVHDASRPADPWRLSTRTHTEWTFVSGTTPAGPAQPLALLELNYHLKTDLRGDTKAGSSQHITLEAGPQAGGGPDVGTVGSVTLDVSYDDGATWQPVTLRKEEDGGWRGKFKAPEQSDGFISVRAGAVTDAGWSISQEIIRAYGLR